MRPTISPAPHRHGIVPPYLLRALARNGDTAVAEPARTSLLIDDRHRRRRAAPGVRPDTPPARRGADSGSGPRRTIADAHGTTTLPGGVVRHEGADAVGDAAADEAYDGLGATWQLFHDVYGRDSLDGAGLPLDATVHYGREYDNAFWDGSRMVFGDGDGQVFTRFTVAVDVIGHELTHGVTEKTARLVYQGQSGALNESISDVFGSLVKQRALGQDAHQADWLIGAGLFLPSVQGSALRSMRAPGSAYDDPVLGRDPQPATMAGYLQTQDDNGGVHTNSGIANHAFYLAATTMGGRADEGAGWVWYDVLTGGELAPDADFAAFAALTVAAAAKRFGAGSTAAGAVADAWARVGVTAPGAPRGQVSPATSDPVPAPAVLGLRRSGGIAGLRLEREIELASMPDPQAAQWLSLLESGLLQQLPAAEPAPDRYVYHVWAPGFGLDVEAAEHQLTPDVIDTFEQTLRLPAAPAPPLAP